MRDVLVIVGPTAVGKTAVAVELATCVRGEIVSADSMAVYKGMDVGTAKPTADERARASFHMIDVADPGMPFNAGEFQRLAHQAIDDILRRKAVAIVVGGSGLYVRAAVDGLDTSVPAENVEVRRSLTEEAGIYGNQRIHEKLKQIDPISAERIHPNNLKRVIRALEIFESTGVPASALFEKDAKRDRTYPNARFFGLFMDRNCLYERIEHRIDRMIEAGLVEEVSALLDRGVDINLPSMQGLGYKEIAAYLGGNLTRHEAVALLKKNTRRFAKRQYTWFRADPRIEWINVETLTAKEVSQIIKERLTNEQDSNEPAG